MSKSISIAISAEETYLIIQELNCLGDICHGSGDRERMGRSRNMARTLRDRIDALISYEEAKAQGQEPPRRDQLARAVKTSDGVTRVKTHPGIGDIAWTYCQLRHVEEVYGSPVEFWPHETPDKRSREFVELLPGVKFGGWSDGPRNHEDARESKPWIGHSVGLSINEHMERGGSVDAWMSDLPCTWDLELDTTTAHVQRAQSILGQHKGLLVGVYTSSHAAANAMGWWREAEWLKMCRAVHEKTGCAFVVLGAGFDAEPSRGDVKNLAPSLIDKLRADRIPVRECIGQHFGIAWEVLMRCNLFIAYPSGLPITAAMGGTKTVWWLPDRQVVPKEPDRNWKNLTGWIHPSWVDDGRVETLPMGGIDEGIAGVLNSRPFLRMMEKR